MVICYYNEDKTKLFKCEIIKSTDVIDESFFKSKINETHEWHDDKGNIVNSISNSERNDLDLFLVEK